MYRRTGVAPPSTRSGKLEVYDLQSLPDPSGPDNGPRRYGIDSSPLSRCNSLQTCPPSKVPSNEIVVVPFPWNRSVAPTSSAPAASPTRTILSG